MKIKSWLPIFSLLFGAFVWGIIWYPYRLMANAGVSGIYSSFYVFILTIAIALPYFFIAKKKVPIWSKDFWLLALVAGYTNISYVLAVIDGEVVRVMLLFYISPVWTIFLAHFMLNEDTQKRHYIAVFISLIGAFIMFWEPGYLIHLDSRSDWLALSSGLGFAITNVMTRKHAHMTVNQKALAIWLGVIVVAMICIMFDKNAMPTLDFFRPVDAAIMMAIALSLFLSTLLVQFGVTQIKAVEASSFFLFEIVVAAISSYFLVGESIALKEWLGGILIIAGVILSAKN
ncbi:DMT family transporter [Candidatus Methylopumilus planktonicus]|uniref:DMT family transporter n=1 Tax=Candidatus Methylopumilus TaxID=1679002 RepID=UPI00111F516D|nr:DMT family transporter [Candidatus Methylopumilus planktonicus]QDD00370.1 DMT family transporter [Candidatus Methylopumilus planktonicus]QDD06989.1 DMT family transporter [Candidatus Methylopumilus planktonicus]QDD08324.1 DMT family transporter [Candidatus Methylopumilus planktonicus]QDD09651.1 DMT family transporter [Candidatus Methylopumilus planktonicus]